ncbi:MAG: hypothetical protein FJ225_06120 [Lentisphaerae bacterium]|nr:hypothetical protein [Lentisphaerota bacterium]
MSENDSQAPRTPPAPPSESVFTVGESEAAELVKVAPRDRLYAILSGMGYYKLSHQRRKQLRYIMAGSVAAYVAAMAIFGGWVVMRSRQERETVFTTPPPTRTYEPRKLEHRVKVQKRQRSSSRPAMLPRLVAMRPSELSLPEIKVDPKIVHTTFQPKFKAVSGKGLGAGLGTGYGADGFGQGVSSVDFFGIRARGDRIAILVDVSVSMVEEQKGGVPGYMRVKQRVENVIDALAETGLFSTTVFADAGQTLFPKMVIASDENKKKAKLFIRPYNTEGNWGLTQGNVSQSSHGLPAGGGTTRLDLALTAAYLQGADTILVISDGLPKVRRVFSADQLSNFQAERNAWMQANAGRVAAAQAAAASYAAAQAAAPTVVEKVWVPPTPARPPRPPSKSPPKEGQAPDMGDPGAPAQPGYWREVVHRQGGGGGAPPMPQPPPMPDPGWWSFTDFVRHLTMLYEALYAKQGRKPPQIHCIGYQIDEDGHQFLQSLAKEFHGKYRRVRELR